MDKQEAVRRIEEHMRIHKTGEYPHVFIAEALHMALNALRRQHPENKPLTLDELREMDGEPVYVVEITGRGEWLFRRNHGFMDVYGDWDTDAEMRFDRYGELWWAYRHKPKEE